MKIAAYLIEKIGSTASGYFHPSLWLSESHELLVTQSHHGIDSCGAARWQVGGRQGYRQQDCSRDAEAQRIGRANSEEPGAQQSRCCKRQCRAEYHSGQYHAESLAEKKEIGSTRLNSSHRCSSYA